MNEVPSRTVQAAADTQEIGTEHLGDTLQRIRNYAREHIDHYLEIAWQAERAEMLLGDTDKTYIVTLSETEWADLADHLVIDHPTLAAV